MSRSLILQKTEGKPGQVYYPLQLKTVSKPVPTEGQLLIRIHAAALNHRDYFIRRHLYPAIAFDHPMLADGCGTVVGTGPSPSARAQGLLGQRVVLTPMRGWDAAPEGPERPEAWTIVGSARGSPVGMAADYAVVGEDEVEPAPPHLSAAEAAALPLVGLTAWRALVTKSGNAAGGRNVLITGIGGGVALAALQFAVAMGVNVLVSSGSQDKIDRAVRMGAQGGVNYREEGWEKKLPALLPADRPYLDAVIDGAGGDVVGKTVKYMKSGAVIAQYGMTVGPKMDWLMSANLRNIELKGSTMGSRKEFAEMVAFVREKGIKPVISGVAKGLDNLQEIDGLFTEMKEGRQFGKLVIEISAEGETESGAKL
ncbi:NAD(P)-binding protein [Xylariaceae sp. FL0016]|nr:NAD(P)-binding protein [Xylariaceae sp. FL0016]